MARLSYGMMARYPADQAVGLIRLAEALGFHGCYLSDEPTGRDPWALLAAAARETGRIRLGPSATHVYLREPTLIAQALATLDELSGGRAEAAVSFGDPAMLDAYGIDWRGGRPLARVREAIGVMRDYLDQGEVSHEGEFFRCDGIAATARPVQERVPLLLGAIGGPRSFRLAGEVADGVHCTGCSRENSAYVVDRVAEGAERAGRDRRRLDLGAVCLTAVAEDAAVAMEAARPVAAQWLPSMPQNMLERHGLDPAEVAVIGEAVAAGDVERALALTRAEMVDALSVAGTPRQCAERIRERIVEPGIDHVIMAIVDPAVVEAHGGRPSHDLPGAAEQLRLISDHVLPALR